MTLFQSLGFLGSDYLGVGEVLQHFHIYIGSEHFFLSKYFWEYEDLWIFFFLGWGGGGGGEVITKSDYFFWRGGGSFLYILGLFKVKIQNGNIF